MKEWIPIPWGGPSAGRWSFVWRGFGVHVLPELDFRQWGLTEEWYDGPMGSFGLGPFLLISWLDTAIEALKKPTTEK